MHFHGPTYCGHNHVQVTAINISVFNFYQLENCLVDKIVVLGDSIKLIL